MDKLAFVDQLSGKIKIDYTKKWIKSVFDKTGKQFGDRYGDHNGELLYSVDNEVRDSRRSSFDHNGFELTLVKATDKLTEEFTTTLIINCNPSAIYFGGNNYRNIPFDAFKAILNEFCDTFSLDIDKIKITTPFEPSFTVVNPLNLVLNEESIRGRIITFQDKEFGITTNSHGDRMGYEANNSHFRRKVYLPEVKFRETLNYLRIESSYNRIKTFTDRTAIYTWGDLCTDNGQYECYKVGLKGWDDTNVYDPTLKTSKKYKPYLNEMIGKGGNADYWLKEFPLTASDKTRTSRIDEYRKLSFLKGDGLHTRIRNIIQIEGEKFRNVTTWLTCKNTESINTDILINKALGESEDNTEEQLINTEPEEVKNKRYCISCNKDISHQKENSRYCSEKYVGDRKCRNKSSNSKHNAIRSAIRADKRKTKQLLLLNKNSTTAKPVTLSRTERLQQLKERVLRNKLVPV